MDMFTFSAPVDICFGVGVINGLGDQVKAMGKRVLLITDKGIVGAGVADTVTGVLKKAGLDVVLFTEIQENPRDTTCINAAQLCAAEGCDVVVGLGGGSPMDVAKVVAVMMTNPGKHPREFEGRDKMEKDPMPFVLVPTTAGTAAEVTYNAVIVDTERTFKFTIISKRLAPKLAVLDPQLTAGKPAGLTASTGMDALTHAIESYTNTLVNPIADALAVKAIQLIGGSLRTAVVQGQNLQARSDMLLGSLIAGLAFNMTRLGLVHAMSHPMSAYFDVPHGIANAMLLSPIMEFNMFGALDRTAEIGRLLGEKTCGLSPVDAGLKGVAAVRRLADDVGIPHWLKEVGVTADRIPEMVEQTMKSGNVLVNPRQVKPKDVAQLFSNLIG
ncbi:MAG TPA: iron-containing alcohol dehydrogenase [Symbiobacteriaceae bacterium]|nr:iron-containing alcohol dehydrogenase [Symbiobacteriaceae bacterium]